MSRPMYSKYSIVLRCALLLLALPARQALGHAYPAVSIPNNGATVKEPPRELRIQFTEAVEVAFSQITVKGSNGEIVSQQAAAISERHVGDRFEVIERGKLFGRMASAVSRSHVTDGVLRFTVGAPTKIAIC